MALAPYIGKAALGAPQLLSGVSPKKFEELLEPVCVGIALNASDEGNLESERLSELITNFTARLYPKLHVAGTVQQTSSLTSLATAINPNIEFRSASDVTVWVVVGDRDVAHSSTPIVHASSEGWTARISSEPKACGHTRNPFGAAAAACLAAANVFRIIFSNHLLRAVPDQDTSLCLFDYKVNDPACECGHPEPAGLLAEHTVLVGAGAIGNGTLWALSRSSLSGVIDVVDPESVDETNPQRYVLAMADARMPKTDLAVASCQNSRILVNAFQGTWTDFVEADRGYSLVAAAVDTAQIRVEIQSSLPRHVLNAWTQSGDLGVSRHRFLGDQACLACLYIPPRARPSDDLLIHQAIRFSGDIMAVRNMLHSDAPLDMGWIQRIAADMKIDTEKVLPFLGRPLRDLYNRGICGGLFLDLSNENEKASIEVPMAFQSAMAGIMLGAEIALYSMGQESPPPVTTKINLLQPLGAMLSEPEFKHPSGRCICQDSDFIAAYMEKFNISE